jgi:2-haloacid dehalogenase
MVEALKGLTDRVQRPLTRDQILGAHARHESSQQHYTPATRYRDLLPIVYKRLAEEWGVHATYEDCVEYGRSEPGLFLLDLWFEKASPRSH